MERFAEAFAPCGFRREAFYPCYGLAEATLIVSGGDRRRAARGPPVRRRRLACERSIEVAKDDEGRRTLVGCGRHR